MAGSQSYLTRSGGGNAVDLDHQNVTGRAEAMIIKSDTPQHKELTEGDILGASALQPYLARRVVSVHGSLHGPESIHP